MQSSPSSGSPFLSGRRLSNSTDVTRSPRSPARGTILDHLNLAGLYGLSSLSTPVIAEPSDSDTWDSVLEYALKRDLRSRPRVTGFISAQRITGRWLIERDDSDLTKMIQNDSDLLEDVCMLSHRLQHKARHSVSPVQSRSPKLWEIFPGTPRSSATSISEGSPASSARDARSHTRTPSITGSHRESPHGVDAEGAGGDVQVDEDSQGLSPHSIPAQGLGLVTEENPDEISLEGGQGASQPEPSALGHDEQVEDGYEIVTMMPMDHTADPILLVSSSAGDALLAQASRS
ncbi:hypothetical protein POSPLADRAFT_1036061 [Postia placenta MAD-698-R-SB12]|uniref:Uncharacterized protein n=1 Tax=Postia placenta MAD-698-R-SB12 TaxID=670580 RepID=A0A1X6MRK1_9APHY|nr:hypothetical protein POSPLADRAFT_1036061 [Postia placenta MAD-698-R-SB12]OSX59017.1 hypothetical protein POSPLADRAFT_1036061 [Postia placenta MAD-698-R-SB12]